MIKKKDNRGPLELTRQIGELQCENEGLRNKVHDAELETSLIKAVGMNSPEMKAAKAKIQELQNSLDRFKKENNECYNRIADLKETLNSRDYTRQHDYQFLIDENRTLEQERNELIIDNKKLAQQIDDQVDRLRKVGAL